MRTEQEWRAFLDAQIMAETLEKGYKPASIYDLPLPEWKALRELVLSLGIVTDPWKLTFSSIAFSDRLGMNIVVYKGVKIL